MVYKIPPGGEVNHIQPVAYNLCASVYMCFVVTCWERADLLALVCSVFCEFVTFPLVSWVRCGTWLYRFLIFATLLLWFYFYKWFKKKIKISKNVHSCRLSLFKGYLSCCLRYYRTLYQLLQDSITIYKVLRIIVNLDFFAFLLTSVCVVRILSRLLTSLSLSKWGYYFHRLKPINDLYAVFVIRFPTMWYMWPAKTQTSLHICAVWSESMLVI